MSGSLTPGVELGDLRIVPLADLAEIDVGQRLPRQPQRRADAGQVVGDGRTAERHRNLQHRLLGAPELFGVHRNVGGAEVHVFSRELLDAAAAADGLVVDGHVGPLLVVNVEGF